jgi:biotin operon repressor
LRGRVLGALIENKSLSGEDLLTLLRADRMRLAKAVAQLKDEGFIREGKGSYRLA